MSAKSLTAQFVPFSIPSRFSFYTGIETINRIFAERTAASSPAGMTGIPNMVNTPGTGDAIDIGASAASISPIEIVWLIGMCACAVFFIIAYIKCRREFKTSLPVENDFVTRWLREYPLRRTVQIRQSDRIKAPLTYGVFRPVVLLPRTTDWTDEIRLKVILTHEFTHIRRFDTLTKLVLTAAVCVHWFNPLVWVMYVLANRDIELACDEAVVRKFGETIKSAYALTLIGLEETKNPLTPLISGFSRNAIEERIVSIMKMKKSSLVGIILALALVIGTTTVFATNAASAADASSNNTPDSISSITTKAGATVNPSSVDFGTHMDIELNKDSILLLGRETWEKGDKIVFRISADEDMALCVGILPAENMDSGFGYNDYGQFIQQRLDDVNSKVQEVSFVVPETGEYGIGVQHISYEVNSVASTTSTPENKEQSNDSDKNNTAVSAPQSVENDTVSIDLEVNKVFENPLIKE